MNWVGLVSNFAAVLLRNKTLEDHEKKAQNAFCFCNGTLGRCYVLFLSTELVLDCVCLLATRSIECLYYYGDIYQLFSFTVLSKVNSCSHVSCNNLLEDLCHVTIDMHMQEKAKCGLMERFILLK